VVASGLLGAAASGAALRPLRRVAGAARTVAGGDLEASVEPTGDHDLDPVVDAFNSMVAELRERLERDARFASDVTHELRGPLATLAAAADHARRHAEDPVVVRESLDLLSQTVERFSGLVVDLLEISRLDAGAVELHVEPVEVAALVHSVVDAARSMAVVTIEPDVPTRVPMDKRRIGRALANLLENADRYGGGATAVTARRAGGRLELVVDDAGPGIPEHERSYVLGRFARGTAAREVSGGTGLGLALVAEHLRVHGGEVRIADAPGGGARMVLALPLEGPPA
jgi:signal transduction histidine kinase